MCLFQIQLPLIAKMALALLTEEEQIKFIRGAQIEQEKLKLKTDQGKRLVPIFLDILNDAKDLEYDLYCEYFQFLGLNINHFSTALSSAQEDVGVKIEGQPLPQEINGDLITKMRECLAVTRRKILVEVKAQRLADSHGIFGWEVVKGKLIGTQKKK